MGELFVFAMRPFAPKGFQPVPVVHVVLGPVGAMGVFVVGLYEAVEPVGIVLLEGLHGWVLFQVGNDSIVLKLQQHRQEQSSHVLSLVLEPDQLQ